MPIYSEPQVKAPNHNAFAANIVISFLRLDAQELIFSAQKYENMRQWHNGAAWLEHCLRSVIWIKTICKGRAYPGSAGPGIRRSIQ